MRKSHVVFSILAAILMVGAAAAPLPQLFVTSDRCISCHNGLISPKGADVSIGADWRSSMMANSSRDPYWQAAVRREILVRPAVSAEIQHECSACHMPMMRYTAKILGEKGSVFNHLPVAGAESKESQMAADGVSCSMCHQIKKDNLGSHESYTAGFIVDNGTPLGERPIYGPYEVDEGRKALMRSSAQFLPEKGEHIQGSELCATCHTLFTHALDEEGEVVGEIAEQVPYLEWKHSDYSGSKDCQFCHMPVVEGEMPITGVLGKDRDQFSRHVFKGGNFFIPRILNKYRNDLGVKALPQEMATTAERSARHLETSAARMSIADLTVTDERLKAEVLIENLAGHKLPTAYPSRRAWIHFQVVDGHGETVFESGRLNPDGSIAGNDNDADKDRFEPHYRSIQSPDEVQIYEDIMAGPDGKVTTVLLTAVRYLKDNRILPEGFDKATAPGDVAVNGKAAADADFTGGRDGIRYDIPLGGRSGPFTVRAELWYQPIGYRWAHNLAREEAFEINRFVRYFKDFADSSGLCLASTSVEIR
jgi:hypothetical protein